MASAIFDQQVLFIASHVAPNCLKINLLVISYARGNKRSTLFASSDRKTPIFFFSGVMLAAPRAIKAALCSAARRLILCVLFDSHGNGNLRDGMPYGLDLPDVVEDDF